MTFEVDDVDRAAQSRWSVLVRGHADEVTDVADEELLLRTVTRSRRPWVLSEHDHWLRIIPHDITGRRVARGQLLGGWEPGGYL